MAKIEAATVDYLEWQLNKPSLCSGSPKAATKEEKINICMQRFSGVQRIAIALKNTMTSFEMLVAVA